MNKRKLGFWIVAGSVLLIGGLFVGGLGMLGRLPWQSGDLYEDPQRRFSMEVGPWEHVETDGSYTQFKLAEPSVNLYVFVFEAQPIDDAFSQAFEIIGFDTGILTGDLNSIGDWQASSIADPAGFNYGLAGQTVGDKTYVAVVKADELGVRIDGPEVLRALGSLKMAGKEQVVMESYADLETMVQKQVDSLAGSVSVAVVHDNEIVYSYTYGQSNPIKGIAANTGTIYAFGSMTKPFTATAVMQLVEQGKVNVDAWPGEYIPEFPERWKVTVRQLLDHSACMPDNERLTLGLVALPGESFASLEEIFTIYVKNYPDLVCEPGKTSQYSNPHYLALARIVEEVSGEPYETYVIEHILTPLAMDSTRFQLVEMNDRYAKIQFSTAQKDKFIADLNEYHGPSQEAIFLQKGESFSTLNDYRILPPWGGLRGTPSDVTHFLQMYINDGRYGDSQILQPKTVAAMQEMQTSTDGSPLGFGLSWWLGKDDFGEYYYHDGGGAGFENTMRIYPDLDLGVVVMGSVSGYQKDKIAEGLVNIWMHEK
jgi:CubicO group peptidase (beta-lactamase class C family)